MPKVERVYQLPHEPIDHVTKSLVALALAESFVPLAFVLPQTWIASTILAAEAARQIILATKHSEWRIRRR